MKLQFTTWKEEIIIGRIWSTFATYDFIIQPMKLRYYSTNKVTLLFDQWGYVIVQPMKLRYYSTNEDTLLEKGVNALLIIFSELKSSAMNWRKYMRIPYIALFHFHYHFSMWIISIYWSFTWNIDILIVHLKYRYTDRSLEISIYWSFTWKSWRFVAVFFS